MSVVSAPRATRPKISTAEQLGLFGPAPTPELPRQPCAVCGAWGAFGMSWPLTPEPVFWCFTHRPADFYTRRPS